MVSAVIPARNEEERIAATVAAVMGIAELDEIIVVDDGSYDETAARAEAAGADVLKLPQNRGKGGAMNAGARAASGDVLLFVDADLGASASEADKLLAPILANDADMSVAQFPINPGRGGGFGLAVGLARTGIEKLTGRTMVAPLSGQRALRKSVWERVGGVAPGFGAEVALTIDALRAGFRVVEIPTSMSHRVTARDWRGVRHRARQFLHIARALAQRRARSQ